jgi:hypothetical protein
MAYGFGSKKKLIQMSKPSLDEFTLHMEIAPRPEEVAENSIATSISPAAMNALRPTLVTATPAIHTSHVEMRIKCLAMKTKPDAMSGEATAMNVCSVAMHA